MNSKISYTKIKDFLRDKKILIGILAVGIVFVGGWWGWNNKTIENPKGICGLKGMGLSYDISYCDKSCRINDDCKYTCGCGVINKNEICYDEGIIYDCVDRKVECKDGKCIIRKELLQDTIIAKEQAITIASQEEEVKEFLKLYPDAKIDAMQHCCAEVKVYGGKCHCINSPDDNWIVSYYINETGWEFRYVSSVRVAINSKSGAIIAKFPKLEYLKNKGYCEEDNECIAVGCGIEECKIASNSPIINFIYYPFISMQINCPACQIRNEIKCVDNVCVFSD